MVTFTDGITTECTPGTTVGSLPRAYDGRDGLPYIAALVNNDLVSLSYEITYNSTIEYQTRADSHGWRLYRNSLCFLLAKAVRDLYPEATFSLEHSFGMGFYCSFRNNGEEGIQQKQLERIDARMRDLVAQNFPIKRVRLSYTDAVQKFEASGQTDKLKQLQFANPPSVVGHHCEGFWDIAHAPLAPRTGVLDCYALIHYAPGFVLHFPERESPTELKPFQDQPNLFTIFQEHKNWGRILGVDTVGRLNEIIHHHEIQHFMRTAEALHEKKLTQIADAIAARRDQTKVVLIAGPSSAGKTTFAKRLMVHLRVNGLRPITIGTDDYFVGEDRNPVDADGNPDFEHLEAVDIPVFNADLSKLISGESIERPHFNFNKKRREYHGEYLQLDHDQLLLVEGIHGLNPRLTEEIAPEHKFKIYVSALTQLSIDSNNRISTTDNRLMRRMVRDSKYRGHSALATLRQWPSVRRGEKRWVFPFQQEADATFNSALDYELAVLKPVVEPLLLQIKSSDPEYAEARRLSAFLVNFIGVDTRDVPRTSILREYIGGSAFRY